MPLLDSCLLVPLVIGGITSPLLRLMGTSRVALVAFIAPEQIVEVGTCPETLLITRTLLEWASVGNPVGAASIKVSEVAEPGQGERAMGRELPASRCLWSLHQFSVAGMVHSWLKAAQL